MSAQNKDLARAYFEKVLNEKNLGVCDEILAQEFTEHSMAPFERTAAGKVNGPAAMRETAQYLFDQLPDMKMTVASVIAENDLVAARVIVEATSALAADGANGGRFAAEQMHFFRVENGKLAEHWAVRDDLAAMLQLYGVHPLAAADGAAPSRPIKAAATKRSASKRA